MQFHLNAAGGRSDDRWAIPRQHSFDDPLEHRHSYNPGDAAGIFGVEKGFDGDGGFGTHRERDFAEERVARGDAQKPHLCVVEISWGVRVRTSNQEGAIMANPSTNLKVEPKQYEASKSTWDEIAVSKPFQDLM